MYNKLDQTDIVMDINVKSHRFNYSKLLKLIISLMNIVTFTTMKFLLI